MNVRITQIDGTLPNLALIRLAAHHRARGDQPEYGAVYGSAILKFSADRVARFQEQFPGAIVGGTGTVESAIGDVAALDYDLYMGFDASSGFTQRGFRLARKFCVVPAKEGKPRPVAGVAHTGAASRGRSTCTCSTTTFFGEPGCIGRFRRSLTIRLVPERIVS
jgi:hypothetical protein